MTIEANSTPVPAPASPVEKPAPEALELKLREAVRRAQPAVTTFERKLRDIARRTLDQLARLTASWAVSLNRLAETVGRPAHPAEENEPRDGVIPEVPAA